MLEFTQFHRNKRGQTVGLFRVRITEEDNGRILASFGFSLCAISRGDRYSKRMGKEIADGRLQEREDLQFFADNIDREYVDQYIARMKSLHIPLTMHDTFDRVVNRSRRIAASFERNRQSSREEVSV